MNRYHSNITLPLFAGGRELISAPTANANFTWISTVKQHSSTQESMTKLEGKGRGKGRGEAGRRKGKGEGDLYFPPMTKWRVSRV